VNVTRKVELVPHDPNWAIQFEQEAKLIKRILRDNCLAIHHIGSTAIPNIHAKPVIDCLIEVNDLNLVDKLNSEFEKLGYECKGEFGIPGRRFYQKGGEQRTHHIHLFQQGNPEIARHLAFRDFMLANPNYAKAYSAIKRCLAEVFPYDIASYIKGKASFVQMIDYQTGHAPQEQLQASDDIVILPYDNNWEKLAAAEIAALKMILSKESYIRIEHLGSTSVLGISAKPIIDLYLSVPDIENTKLLIQQLKTLGYDFWEANPNKKHHRLFKGMPPFGKGRTHHLHIFADDNPRFDEKIKFRNALKNSDSLRDQYQALKLQLKETTAGDREKYTAAKGEFIKQVLAN
jgi:GrpB-like predicted nucleotidyltransferase (UPF0157 family)